MNQLRRVRLLMGVVFCVVVVTLITRFESGFNRPPLSARPQVWLSKPVDWLFETRVDEIQIAEKDGSDLLQLQLRGVDDFTTRAKDAGALPLKAPIQTEILLSTLSDIDFSVVNLTIEGIGSDGVSTLLKIRAKNVRMDDSELVIDEATVLDSGAVAEYGEMNLTNAVISMEVSVGTCQPRESRQVCPLADFSGANLSRGDFESAVLRGADFTGATMSGSKLGGADLSGAILQDVDLTNAWLVGVDLGEAFMENVEFSGSSWTR